jgi:hypothetical protein
VFRFSLFGDIPDFKCLDVCNSRNLQIVYTLFCRVAIQVSGVLISSFEFLQVVGRRAFVLFGLSQDHGFSPGLHGPSLGLLLELVRTFKGPSLGSRTFSRF